MSSTLKFRLLIGSAFLMSLAGLANDFCIRYAILLLLVPGFFIFLFIAYKGGIHDPTTALAIILASNGAILVACVLRSFKDHLFPPSGGISPFSGVEAFWVLAFVPLSIYEVITIISSFRLTEKRTVAIYASAAFLLQLADHWYLYYLANGV